MSAAHSVPSTRILAGLVLGAVVGCTANALVQNGTLDGGVVSGVIKYATKPVGDIFLNLLFMAIIPLVFASSAFVPTALLPDWLAWFAERQPVSQTIEAIRYATFGIPQAEYMWNSLAWSVGTIAVAATLCSWRFRRAS